MARYPKSIGKSVSVGYAPATSSRHSNSRNIDPFGPGMAEDLFGIYDYDEFDDVCEVDDGFYNAMEELDPENLYDGVTQSFHFRFQADLDLETNEEREANLRSSIRRFEAAYRRMSLYALKWHYLLEEVEENEQYKKMFKDMQMMRKLGGSNRV